MPLSLGYIGLTVCVRGAVGPVVVVVVAAGGVGYEPDLTRLWHQAVDCIM